MKLLLPPITRATASIDINDHVLVIVRLVIRPSALVQSCPFDDHGRAPPWQGRPVYRRSTDSPPRRPAGNTGDTPGCRGPADSRFSFVDRSPAGQGPIGQKAGHHYATPQYDVSNPNLDFHYLSSSVTSSPILSTLTASSFFAPSGTLKSN